MVIVLPIYHMMMVIIPPPLPHPLSHPLSLTLPSSPSLSLSHLRQHLDYRDLPDVVPVQLRKVRTCPFVDVLISLSRDDRAKIL